jgi:hypothetical protein
MMRNGSSHFPSFLFSKVSSSVFQFKSCLGEMLVSPCIRVKSKSRHLIKHIFGLGDSTPSLWITQNDVFPRILAAIHPSVSLIRVLVFLSSN